MFKFMMYLIYKNYSFLMLWLKTMCVCMCARVHLCMHASVHACKVMDRSSHMSLILKIHQEETENKIK